MAYADKEFYRNTYIGRECTVDATLDKWLDRASDDIDVLSPGIDTTDYSAAKLTLLKKACCAQAEQYVIAGDDSGGGGFESGSLGAFSIKVAASASDPAGGLCDRAGRYLYAAGLSFRGVYVCR